MVRCVELRLDYVYQPAGSLYVEDWALTVVCAYAPNSSSENSTFLKSLVGVLESAPKGDSIGLLGDIGVHMGNDSVT